MLKKTIKYTNFNDEEMEEDFFFHLSKAELVELEMSVDGGLSEMMQKVIAAEDGKTIIAQFKQIILLAYGQKSPDGRRFIKNQQLRDEFESTEAYSTLFMELVTDADAAAIFINGIIPSDLAEEAAKVVNTDERALSVVPEEKDKEPQKRIISREEFDKMDYDQLKELREGLSSGNIVIAE